MTARSGNKPISVREFYEIAQKATFIFILLSGTNTYFNCSVGVFLWPWRVAQDGLQGCRQIGLKYLLFVEMLRDTNWLSKGYHYFILHTLCSRVFTDWISSYINWSALISSIYLLIQAWHCILFSWCLRIFRNVQVFRDTMKGQSGSKDTLISNVSLQCTQIHISIDLTLFMAQYTHTHIIDTTL